ncbi:MAG: hypothetical protein FWC57_01190, partial [Endomicrobia bacterium]|nr:hypothetical protein [Endomicrobiia bacterium]
PDAKVTRYDYDDETVKALMASTGATRAEVLNQLNIAQQTAQSKGVDFQTVLDTIMGLIKKGVELVNDAALALKQVVGTAASAGSFGLAAIAVDIINALAGGADKDSAVETYTGSDGKTYVRTSMEALNTVLNKNGKASAGYGTTVENFMDSLAPGESAILWVDGNRFITVTKRQEWNSKESKYDIFYEVTDPNRYDGQSVKYDADNFKNLITGKRATSADGKTNLGYKGSEDGKVNFLAAGSSTRYSLDYKTNQNPGSVSVLTGDQMSAMKGTTDRTKKVLAVALTEKTVWKTGTREVIVEQPPAGSGVFVHQIQTYQYQVTITELSLEEREGTEADWKEKGDSGAFGQEGLKEMQKKYNGEDGKGGLNEKARAAAQKAAETAIDNNSGVLANVIVTGTQTYKYTLNVNGLSYTMTEQEWKNLYEGQVIKLKDNGYQIKIISVNKETGAITYDVTRVYKDVTYKGDTYSFDDANLAKFLNGQEATDIDGKTHKLPKAAAYEDGKYKIKNYALGADWLAADDDIGISNLITKNIGTTSANPTVVGDSREWTVTDKNDPDNKVVFGSLDEFEKYTKGEKAVGKDGKTYQNPAYAGGVYNAGKDGTPGTVNPGNGSSTQNDMIKVITSNDGSTSVNFYIGGETILDTSITLPKGTDKSVIDEVKNMILAGKNSDEIADYLKKNGIVTDENIKDNGISDIINTLADKFGMKKEDVVKAFADAFKGFSELPAAEQKAFLAGMKALADYLSYPDAKFDIPAAKAAAAALNRQDVDIVGLKLVLNDIAAGRFSKDNILVASGGKDSAPQTVLIVSLAAIKELMTKGSDDSAYEGYGLSVDDIINYLNYNEKSPESVVIQVSGNNFITITKGADGTYNLVDSSIKDGKGINLTKDQLKALLSGEDIFVGSEQYKGYKIDGAPGSLKALTNSKIPEKDAAKKLTDKQMEAQTGGQYVDIPVMSSAIEKVTETRSYTDADGTVHYYEVTVQRVVQKEQTQRVWAGSSDDWETTKDKDGNDVKTPKAGSRAEAEQKAYDARLTAQDASLRAQAAEFNMDAEATAFNNAVNDAANGGKGEVNVSVTATVDADGNIWYNVTDPNMNGGKTVTFSKEEYEKLQKGLSAEAKDGQKYQGLAQYNEEYKNNLAAAYFVSLAEAVSTAKDYLDMANGAASKAVGALADAKKMFDNAFNTLVDKLGITRVAAQAMGQALYDAITYIYGLIGALQQASIDAVLVLANSMQSILAAATNGALTSVANPLKFIGELAAKLATGIFIKDEKGEILGVVVNNGDGSVGVWGALGKEGDLWIDESLLGKGELAGIKNMTDFVKFIADKMSMKNDGSYKFDDVAWSFDDVSAYLRSTGLFVKESRYDALGTLLYVAENVGYLPGVQGVNGPQMAVLYTFYGNDYYSNNTTVTGAAKGEQKLVVEEYTNFAGNGKTYVKIADTYSVSDTPAGKTSNVPAKGKSGLQINIPGKNINLERRVMFIDNDPNDPPENEDRSLGIKGTDANGKATYNHTRTGYVLDYTGKDGMLNGYETLTVRPDGSVYPTRYDLSGAIIPGGKPKGSDEGQQAQEDVKESFTLLNILSMTLNLDSPQDKVFKDKDGHVTGIMDWDPTTNTYTYYGMTGKEGDLTINDNENPSLSKEHADAIAAGIAAGWTYNDVVAYMKYNGLLSKEVKYDNTGKEIYTAELIDYKNGQSAYKYTFKQDNSDYPALYDAKAGESYIVVEDYSKDKTGKCAIQKAVTYAYDESNHAALTTKDGLKIPNTGKPIRAVQYTYPGDVMKDNDGNPIKDENGKDKTYDAKVLIGIFDDKTGDFTGAYSANISGGTIIGGTMYSVESPASMHFFREVNIDKETTNPETKTIGFDNGMTIGILGDYDAAMKDINNWLAAGWSYEEIVAKLKSEDRIQTETKYDENGKEIYTATRVANDGKGNAAFSYKFAQDYSNQTFLDAKKGETKIVFERYGTVDVTVGDGSQKRTRMTGAITYKAGEGCSGSATQFGLKISGVGAMERAVQFKYPYQYDKEDENGQTQTVKCDGEVIIAVFDANGDIASFNKGLIEKNVLSVTEYKITPEDIMNEEDYKKYLENMGVESPKLKMSVNEAASSITISSGGHKNGELEISGDLAAYKDEVQKMINDGYTYDEIVAYLKHEGVLKTETRYDDNGNFAYTAELVGYRDVGGGKAECAYRYVFHQAYTNGGSLNVAEGDLRPRIVVEEYGTADGKIRETASMTYVEGSGPSSSKNTTQNGMTFKGSVGYLERACEYTYPYDTTDADGNPSTFPGKIMTCVFGSDGKLKAFEFGTMLKGGDVSVYGYDLTKPDCLFDSKDAYENYLRNYHSSDSGGSSGEEKDGPVDFMRKAMQNIEHLKLESNGSLYSNSEGFNSFTDTNENTQLQVYLQNAGDAYEYQTYKQPAKDEKTKQSDDIIELQDALRDLGFTDKSGGQIGQLLRNEIYINLNSIIKRKEAEPKNSDALTTDDIKGMLSGLSDWIAGEKSPNIFGNSVPDISDLYAHWVAGSTKPSAQDSFTQQMQAMFGAAGGTLFDEGENANTKNSIYANHNAFMNNDFYVDMSKARIYSYDSANPNQLSYNTTLGGKNVVVTAQINNPGDWRKNGADINTAAGGSVTYTDESGNSRTVSGVKIDKNFNPVFDPKKDYQVTEQIPDPKPANADKNWKGGYQLNVYNVSNFSADDFLNWDTAAAQSKYGYTWYGYDKDGILTSMGYDYKKGQKARTGIGDDTITFLEDAHAKWTVSKPPQWKEGDSYEFKLESGSGDISAAYSHYRNGKLDATGVFKGSYLPYATGAFVLNGNITVDAGQTMTIDKPKGSSSAFAGKYGVESLKDKKDGEDAAADAKKTEEENNNTQTNAKIIETADSYLVSGGVVSIVNSAFVVIGNGTILHTGSFLFSLGTVVAGQMRIFVENGQYVYRAADSSGTAEVRIIDPNNDNISITTMYDTEGVVKITKYNKAVHAMETIEYKTYNSQTGKYETILNASGFAAVITTITASRAGDTGFGFIVENMAGNSSMQIIIGIDGNIKLDAKENAKKLVVAKVYGKNTSGPNAGDSFVMVITGDAEIEPRYEFRQKDGTVIEMITLDGKTFIGVKKYEVNGSVQVSAQDRQWAQGSYSSGYDQYGNYDPYGNNNGQNNYSYEMAPGEGDQFWQNLKYGYGGFGEGRLGDAGYEWDTSGDPNNRNLYFVPDGTGGGKYVYSYTGYDLISLTLNTDAYGNPYNDGIFFTIGDPMKGPNPLRGPPNGPLTQTYYDATTIRTFTLNFDAATGKLSYTQKIDKFLDPSRNQWLNNEGEYQLPGGEVILAGSVENTDGTRKAIDLYWMKDDGTFQGLRELTQIGDFYIRKADHNQDGKYNTNKTDHTQNVTVIDDFENDINYIITTRSGENIAFGSNDTFGFNQTAGNTFILSVSKTVDSKGKTVFSIAIKLPMAISVDYKYRDPKTGENKAVACVIVAGASVMFTKDANGHITADIFDGILDIGHNTIITGGSGGSSGGEGPDASDTNAVVNDQVKGKDGKVLKNWYEVSNGTISIRGGSLVVVGTGATFKKGSVIGGYTINDGSVKYMGMSDGGVMVLVSADKNKQVSVTFQGKKLKLDSQGLVGNKWEKTTYGDNKYNVLKLDKYGKIEKHAKTWAQKAGKWIGKNWKVVVAVVIIIVAIVVNVIPALGTAVSIALEAVAHALLGSIAAAAIAAGASAAAMGIVAIGLAAAAVGASMWAAGKLTGNKWLINAGKSVMMAGAFVAIMGVAMAAGAVVGTLIKGAAVMLSFGASVATTTLINILASMAAVAVAGTTYSALGYGIRYLGEKTDLEFFEQLGRAIAGSGNNFKVGLLFFEIGWEEGHFGFAWGFGITLGSAGFIGYQKFQSFTKSAKFYDENGVEYYDYFKKTKAGIDISYAGFGITCLWSNDNIYGNRWTIGAQISLNSAVSLSFNINYVEKDPYGSGNSGWSISISFGDRKNGINFGASYNFTHQTISGNLGFSLGKIMMSIGGSYSFKNGDYSFSASLTPPSTMKKDGLLNLAPTFGYNYSVRTDDDGNRTVSSGFSVTITENRRGQNKRDENGNIMTDKDGKPLEGEMLNWGSITLGYTNSKTYDKDGKQIGESGQMTVDIYNNFENMLNETYNGIIKKAQGGLSKIIGAGLREIGKGIGVNKLKAKIGAGASYQGMFNEITEYLESDIVANLGWEAAISNAVSNLIDHGSVYDLLTAIKKYGTFTTNKGTYELDKYGSINLSSGDRKVIKSGVDFVPGKYTDKDGKEYTLSRDGTRTYESIDKRTDSITITAVNKNGKEIYNITASATDYNNAIVTRYEYDKNGNQIGSVKYDVVFEDSKYSIYKGGIKQASADFSTSLFSNMAMRFEALRVFGVYGAMGFINFAMANMGSLTMGNTTIKSLGIVGNASRFVITVAGGEMDETVKALYGDIKNEGKRVVDQLNCGAGMDYFVESAHVYEVRDGKKETSENAKDFIRTRTLGSSWITDDNGSMKLQTYFIDFSSKTGMPVGFGAIEFKGEKPNRDEIYGYGIRDEIAGNTKTGSDVILDRGVEGKNELTTSEKAVKQRNILAAFREALASKGILSGSVFENCMAILADSVSVNMKGGDYSSNKYFSKEYAVIYKQTIDPDTGKPVQRKDSSGKTVNVVSVTVFDRNGNAINHMIGVGVEVLDINETAVKNALTGKTIQTSLTISAKDADGNTVQRTIIIEGGAELKGDYTLKDGVIKAVLKDRKDLAGGGFEIATYLNIEVNVYNDGYNVDNSQLKENYAKCEYDQDGKLKNIGYDLRVGGEIEINGVRFRNPEEVKIDGITPPGLHIYGILMADENGKVVGGFNLRGLEISSSIDPNNGKRIYNVCTTGTLGGKYENGNLSVSYVDCVVHGEIWQGKESGAKTDASANNNKKTNAAATANNPNKNTNNEENAKTPEEISKEQQETQQSSVQANCTITQEDVNGIAYLYANGDIALDLNGRIDYAVGTTILDIRDDKLIPWLGKLEGIVKVVLDENGNRALVAVYGHAQSVLKKGDIETVTNYDGIGWADKHIENKTTGSCLDIKRAGENGKPETIGHIANGDTSFGWEVKKNGTESPNL